MPLPTKKCNTLPEVNAKLICRLCNCVLIKMGSQKYYTKTSAESIMKPIRAFMKNSSSIGTLTIKHSTLTVDNWIRRWCKTVTQGYLWCQAWFVGLMCDIWPSFSTWWPEKKLSVLIFSQLEVYCRNCCASWILAIFFSFFSTLLS